MWPRHYVILTLTAGERGWVCGRGKDKAGELGREGGRGEDKAGDWGRDEGRGEGGYLNWADGEPIFNKI